MGIFPYPAENANIFSQSLILGWLIHARTPVNLFAVPERRNGRRMGLEIGILIISSGFSPLH
jgi:hypothetical protein